MHISYRMNHIENIRYIVTVRNVLVCNTHETVFVNLLCFSHAFGEYFKSINLPKAKNLNHRGFSFLN